MKPKGKPKGKPNSRCGSKDGEGLALTDLLKEIIAVDAAAQERLKAAEAERNELLASLSAKKDALIEGEKRQAQKKAEALSLEKKSEGEKRLEELRARNKTLIERMERLYAEKKEEWADAILSAVLTGQGE